MKKNICTIEQKKIFANSLHNEWKAEMVMEKEQDEREIKNLDQNVPEYHKWDMMDTIDNWD